MLNILITSSGSTPAQILARGLDKDPRVSSIHLADMKADIVTPYLLKGRKRQYVVPNSNDKMCVSVIREIIAANKIDLVIPILPQDIIALQGSIPDDTITTTVDSVMFCDKKNTYEAFERIGIPYPKIWERDSQSIDDDIVRYPLIAKPRSGMAGVGIEVINDVSSLFRFVKKKRLDDYIIQEYLENFEEFTTDVVCDRDGRPMGMCTRKRIETKGGLCTVAETVKTTSEVKEYIERICDSHKFYGQINMQYLRDEDKYYFLEINTRPAGSAAISYEAGMNIAQMIVDAHLKINRNYKEPKVGIRMMRYWNEIYDRTTM